MAALPLDQLNQLHANSCQALADPKRILILYTLAEEARNVSTLAEELGLAQPTVSRHLRVLRQQSLVGTRREGPSVIYYLSDERIIVALDTMQRVMLDALERQTELLTAA